MENEIELRTRVEERLEKMNSYNSQQYDQIENDLEFASGSQWDDEVTAERDLDDRPSITVNLVRTYINRIVNPLRLNSIGMNIETGDDNITELLSGVLRDIESRSVASEAYEIAYENAVTSGLGWIKVGLDYLSEDSLEQRITVESVPNPLSVYIDPYSKKIDGSDAKYAVEVTYIDEKQAKKDYGDEATGEYAFGIDLYSSWNIPEGSVADMTFYEVIEDKQTKYWYADGSVSLDNEIEGMAFIAKRSIPKTHVLVSRFVGQMLVEQSTIDIPYVPLIPVYGDKLFLEREANIRLGGVVHWTKDSQKMVNYYASNELELASLAPKAPFVAAEGQIEGYEEEWATANTRNHSVLPYNPTALNGQAVPPPMRLDNTAQTGGLIASRDKAQSDMGREIGIFDNLLGGMEGANESGKAVLLRQSQGEMATIHYQDNLTKSITQVGRVVLNLMPYVGDVEQTVTIRNKDGKKESVNITLADIVTPELLKTLDIEITSGPAYESRRRESLNAMLTIGQIMPEKMGAMADVIVRELDAPGSDVIADRLVKMLPPELQDNAEEQLPPEVIDELAMNKNTIEQLDQKMGYYEGVIRQLQAQIADDSADRKNDIAKTIINNEGKIAVAQINQEGTSARQAEQIAADAETDMFKVQSDILKDEIKDPQVNLEVDFGVDKHVPQVPGPVNTSQYNKEATVEVERES